MGVRVGATISQLEFLVEAAEAGNMTTAAERLHTSQSNLSVGIAKLERTLGVELLVRRRSKGVLLTPAGADAAARARDILHAVRELEDSARAGRGALDGSLSIGCFMPLTSFYAPALLRSLQERAPELEVSVREASLDVLHRLVRDAELDLALVYDQRLPADLRFQRLASVRPHVIVAPDGALARRASVSLADLVDETMVTYDLPFTMERSRQLFASQGLPVPHEVLATSIESERAFVAAGVGFSILNQRWATDRTAAGAEVRMLELTDAVQPLGLGVITRSVAPSRKVALALELLGAEAARRHPAAG